MVATFMMPVSSAAIGLDDLLVIWALGFCI